MDPQLKKQLAQTIYVASVSSVDGYGKPTFSAPVSTAARVEDDQKVIETTDGTKRQTTHMIITEGAIGLRDSVWLPGVNQTDATLGRRPAQVLRCIDENGADDHYETRV